MIPTPILFIGDNPALPGGLSRIGRDLATLTSRLPEFRVGFLARGGTGCRQLPFVIYPYPEYAQWGESHIQHVWNDFAGDEAGIVFTIWDASRLHWLAQPRFLPDNDLRRFLLQKHWSLQGYFPIDSTGPRDRLTAQTRDTLLGYDRVLTYTSWARDLVQRTLGDASAGARGLDWLPHGINLGTFKIQDRRHARRMFPAFHAYDKVLAIVATNQARKDWGLVAMTCRLLRDRLGRSFKAWWHSDIAMRHWNLHALIADFGLGDCVSLTTQPMPDDAMATAYAACDVTMHPGLGEGFAYPIAESLAAGVPAIHGNYAGGAELLASRKEWLVEPVEMRLDTLHNCFRPVFSPKDWADAIYECIDSKPAPEDCRAMVEHLDWALLWQPWKRWLLAGLVQR